MSHFPNEGPGRNLFTITVFLLTLSWIIVIIRVLVRWRIRSFGVDDVLMCVGLVSYPPLTIWCPPNACSVAFASGRGAVG